MARTAQTDQLIEQLKNDSDKRWIALGYLLENLATDVSDVKANLQNNGYVKERDFLRVEKQLSERITSLEDDRKWLIRTVGAFLIVTILGVAFYIGAK